MEDQWLTLSLSRVPIPQPRRRPSPPPPSPPLPSRFQYIPLEAPMHQFSPPHQEIHFFPPPETMSFHFYEGPNSDLPPQENQDQEAGPSSHQGRKRKLPVRVTKEGKSERITPPYPWATSKRATVYSLEHLLSQGMRTISGTVKCKRCEEQYDIGFDLQEKFDEVGDFTAENKDGMRDRAPDRWMNPVLPTCERCGQENSLKPLITKKKKTTNWLFLFLGQMLGCCKLSYLKYFCKHTKNHRTGAKDRVLYLTYLGLCKQLNPKGPFDP